MIRRTAPLAVFLARHGEADKNLYDIHGGGNEQLTALGEAQARDLGTRLLHHVRSPRLRLVHEPNDRSAAMARYIGTIVNATALVAPESASLDLGDARGLTPAELFDRWPEYAARLTEWRQQGSVMLSYPQAPNGETAQAFSARITHALVSAIAACADDESLVFVGTTSVLSVMHTVLLRDGDIGPHDRSIYFALGDLAGWRLSAEPPTVFLSPTTLHELPR